tara:strand:- start:748 stop:897 length:150 start_codon:yes stop_codon:yes gene_type:complete
LPNTFAVNDANDIGPVYLARLPLDGVPDPTPNKYFPVKDAVEPLNDKRV